MCSWFHIYPYYNKEKYIKEKPSLNAIKTWDSLQYLWVPFHRKLEIQTQWINNKPTLCTHIETVNRNANMNKHSNMPSSDFLKNTKDKKTRSSFQASLNKDWCSARIILRLALSENDAW